MKTRSKQMNDLPLAQTAKQAVLSTLTYFDLFKVPLTRDELIEHLILNNVDERKIDIYLKESPLLYYKEGFFSLNNSKSFWETWGEKRRLQKKYFKKIRRYQWLLSLCPFIKCIALCNTLPFGDVEENSDIDLFVITRRNRLFLARWWLTALTTLFGVRRHGNKIARRFCLSFYITEDAMDLENIALKPTDIYLAYWIKTLEPLCGEYSTYTAFINANSWIQSYFKTTLLKKRHFRKSGSPTRYIKKILEYLTDKEIYELNTRNKQLKSIYKKRKNLENTAGTVIGEDILKFHDHDLRSNIQKEWFERTRKLLQ